MRRRQYLLITMLALAAVVGALFSGEEPISGILHQPNALLFSLCVGYLVSVIFWLMVVVLPESQRRRTLRENLAKHYQQFRYGVVSILLNASVGSHTLDEVKSLTDYKAFKDFFGANGNER